MKRWTFLTLIDVLAFVCFVLLVSTGILLEYLLPPGSGSWASIWSMNRHEWGDIHFWVAVVFFTVLAVHLVLHWRFFAGLIKGRARQASPLRLALGILAALALLALAAAPLVSPVERTDGESGVHQPRGQGQGQGQGRGYGRH